MEFRSAALRDDAVTVADEGGIRTVTLNRPQRRNPLSADVIAGLRAVFAATDADPDVRCVVLASTGPVFSSGHDLREMVGRDSDFYSALFTDCSALMQEIHALRQPVVAQVQGVATAAGCQLVAACDLAIAADTATFATPGVRIGLFCTTPMIEVVRAVGRKRALEMLLTGQPIDAATAADWGLINRAVPAAQLERATRELATGILAASGTVIATGKHAFYATVDATIADAYTHASDVMSESVALPDAQEGMNAFLDKRDPIWTRSAN